MKTEKEFLEWLLAEIDTDFSVDGNMVIRKDRRIG